MYKPVTGGKKPSELCFRKGMVMFIYQSLDYMTMMFDSAVKTVL